MTPRKPHSKLLRLLSLVTAAGLVMAGCGGDGGGQTSAGGVAGETTEAPVAGGTVTIGLESESTGFQPGKDTPAESGFMVSLAIYDALLLRAADGDVKPFLAESYTTSADLKEWTLKLRPGIKFHDGTELTSAVVKENFGVLTEAGAKTQGALSNVSDLVVIDPLSFKYMLKEPNAAFADVLTGLIGMPFSMANYKAKGADISANPVGTGAFMFDKWTRDSQLVVKKNPNYWIQGLPYLDEVIFKPIPDEDARMASLESGSIDMIASLRQPTVRRATELAERERDFKAYPFVGNSTGANIYNTGKAPFDDRRVRQAAVYALNQEQIIDVLGGKGLAPPATQLFTETSPWYSPKVAATYPGKQDVAKAKKLVEEYMADPKRSDAKPVGSPVTFTYNCQPDPSLVELALLEQQMWAAVGLKVELKQVEQALHINNAVGTAPDFKGNYDVNCWRLGGQTDPDTVLFNSFRDPGNGNASNVTDFTTPELQKLLIEGRSTIDIAARKKIYEQIGLILATEVPFSLSSSTTAVVAAKSSVKGVVGWTFPDRTTKGPEVVQSVVTFREVWVKK